MRICMIATRFFTGGFTSSMVNMIQQLAKHQVDVDILLLDAAHNEFQPELPDTVHVISAVPQRHLFPRLEMSSRLAEIKKRMKEILPLLESEKDPLKNRILAVEYSQLSVQRTVIQNYTKMDLQQYDCVISWEEMMCNSFLGMDVTAKKRIGYVHPDYQAAHYTAGADLPVFSKLDHLACISQANADVLKNVFPTLKNKIVYIPNVLNVERIHELSAQPCAAFDPSCFNMLSVCRLDNVSKALDRAVRITKRLNMDGLNFCWYIAGEGPSRAELEKMILTEHISNFILLGDQRNPYPLIRQADLFVLQSRYEGRPVSVDEAMILNTPVLVTDYASAKEQVRNEETGFIVSNDEDAIYQRLHQLILNRAPLSAIRDHLACMDKSSYENVDQFLELIGAAGDIQ